MDQGTWLKKFLEKRHLSIPDGRPLYAYRCGKSEYSVLTGLMRDMLVGLEKRHDYRRFAELFCLFAAETWQRRYAEGTWSYDTIFDVLDQPVPDQNAIRDWIVRGLDWWRREVIVTERGINQYLLTVGCEGGLPIRLLNGADARLAAYFRELQNAFNRFPHADVEDLARQNMPLLPVSLQRDVVYEVSARLVQSIADLQALVEDASDPVQVLDQIKPDWRDELPLPLGNDAVEVLLGKMIRHAQSLQSSGGAPIKWRWGLDAKGDDWFLFAELVLPDNIETEQLSAWTNANEPPARFKILHGVGTQVSSVALLTRVTRRDGTQVYRCESLSRRAVRLIGRLATNPGALLLTAGDHEVPIDVPGDEGLSDLPWVFQAGKHNAQARFLGEGSVRTRNASTLVAVSVEDQLQGVDDGAQFEQIGELSRVNRRLFRIHGHVRVEGPLGDSSTIRCGCDQDRADRFRISGAQLPWVLGDQRVYVGVPAVRQINGQGRVQPISGAVVEWASVGISPSQWSSNLRDCRGRVWLRCTEPESGDVLLRRRIDVVPSRCEIKLQVGAPGQPAYIQLSGLEGAQVSTTDSRAVEILQEGDGVRVIVDENPEEALQEIHLRLQWSERCPLEVALPVPRMGGVFLFAGRPVPRNGLVALERLGATRAVVQGPMNGHYSISAEIKTGGIVDPELARLLWLQEPLKNKGDGKYEALLHQMQESLAELMAMAADVNIEAQLTLQDATGRELSQVRVAHYDLTLIPEQEQGRVTLSSTSLKQLGEEWEDRVTMEMIRLWSPALQTIPLEVDSESDLPAWKVPEGLEAGPWWVVGRDAGWTRFRPLLLTVSETDEGDALSAGEEEDNKSPLIQAVKESDPEVREQRMDELVSVLGKEPGAPDWERLFDYLRLTREHPAPSLQLMNSLVESPDTLALLLLKASINEEDFELAWVLARQLPFVWYLVPAASWLSAAKAHFTQLSEALSGVEGGNEILEQIFASFRERVGEESHGFQVISDWLQELLFPGCSPVTPEWTLMRNDSKNMLAQMPLLIEEMRQALFARIDSESTWPEGPRVLEQAASLPGSWQFTDWGYRRSVLCAPFVAAFLFLKNGSHSNALTLELRRLRIFDRKWFDHGYAIAVCIGLALTSTDSNE